MAVIFILLIILAYLRLTNRLTFDSPQGAGSETALFFQMKSGALHFGA